MRTSSLGPVSVALACLLMMIFMMKGMHGGEGSPSERRYSRRWRAPRSNH